MSPDTRTFPTKSSLFAGSEKQTQGSKTSYSLTKRLRQWLGIGNLLECHPFSGLVHSAGEFMGYAQIIIRAKHRDKSPKVSSWMELLVYLLMCAK